MIFALPLSMAMKLELFHRADCSFSNKVRDYVESHGLRDRITYRDIEEDEESADELAALTEDLQVPCLSIDGEPILESEEIISWLDQNLIGNGVSREAG